MSSTQIFAKRLKEARQEKGWSQTELAKAANTTATTVSKYEVGSETSKPSLELAITFAQVLGVSLEWLCGIEQSEEKANKITGFDGKAYLYSLVRIITELSTDTNTEVTQFEFGGENAVSITIPNVAISSFTSKILDLLKVYRAGSLTEDLYITCVDKVVNDYSSNYDYAFDNFMSKEDIIRSYCAITDIFSSGINPSAGVLTATLDDPLIAPRVVNLFVSEKETEDFKNGQFVPF